MPQPAPFTVSVYRRGASGSSAYREQGKVWDPVEVDLEGDLQPAGGDIANSEHGREPELRLHGFFDSGVDVQQGDGVQVTAGPAFVGRRFEVTEAYDWGAPGDLEAALKQTQEVFE